MISGRGSIELEGRQTCSVGNHRTQIEIENKMHLRKPHSHKHTLRITCHERRGQEARGNSFLRNTLKFKKKKNDENNEGGWKDYQVRQESRSEEEHIFSYFSAWMQTYN